MVIKIKLVRLDKNTTKQKKLCFMNKENVQSVYH